MVDHKVELPCIVCRKPLSGEKFPAAVTFRAYGNCGSTAYDPMYSLHIGGDPHNRHLQIMVCDDCLVAAAKGHRVYSVSTPVIPTPDPQFTWWDPKQDDT